MINDVDTATTGQVLISATNGNITLNVGDDADINGDLTTFGTAATININIDPSVGDADTASVANDGATLDIDTATSIITTNSLTNATAGTIITGGDQNDTFSFQPQTTTDFRINGNPPVFGDADVPPGDTLNLDLVNVTLGDAVLTIGSGGAGIAGVGAGNFDFVTQQDVDFVSIETVDADNGQYHLVMDQVYAGFEGAGPDTIDGRMNGDAVPSGDFEVRVNGTQMYAGQESEILSFTVIGSDDADTFTITETAGGLPLFSADATAAADRLGAPAIDNTGGVGSIGSITNGGASNGAHLGGKAVTSTTAVPAFFGGAATNIAASFETYIEREFIAANDVNLRDITGTQVSIHFAGGDGADAVQFDLITNHDAAYFSDSVDVAGGGNSGNIVITDGDNAAEDPEILLSFANLAPITFNGASGDLRLDASDTAATYQLTLNAIDGDDAGVVVDDDGCESARRR